MEFEENGSMRVVVSVCKIIVVKIISGILSILYTTGTPSNLEVAVWGFPNLGLILLSANGHNPRLIMLIVRLRQLSKDEQEFNRIVTKGAIGDSEGRYGGGRRPREPLRRAFY
jgi:hypothetical protein